MPYSDADMKKKGAKRPAAAAKAANAALAYALRNNKKDAEGYAIRVGLSASNSTPKRLSKHRR